MNPTRLSLVAVAVVCASLGAYLAISSRGEDRLAAANADLLAGRDAHALAELKALEGEAGLRAAVLRARAYRDSGRLVKARRAFQTAVRRDPNNWLLQQEYAQVLLALGQRSQARARMSRAKALNPRMPLPPGFADAK
jgi:Tfp pilus assembly protein PilF